MPLYRHYVPSPLREQAMFAHLCLDDSSAYNPISFVQACLPKGIMPLESPVTAQNDVGEFQSLLMDRLGELFPMPHRRLSCDEGAPSTTGTSATAPSAMTLSFVPGDDLFTRLFGGKTAQQIIGSGACKHARETTQPFLCLTLEVTGLTAPTIEASLEAFTQVCGARRLAVWAPSLRFRVCEQGDRLEGDNSYLCEACGKKVDALKRTALAELPDSLMIALKRFDMDYTTFEVRAVALCNDDFCPPSTRHHPPPRARLQRMKLQDEVRFGETLDLYPFTTAGLRDAEQRGASSMSGGASVGGAAVDIGDDADGGALGLRRDACQYELRGVLVHMGTARGGHYVSYAKPREGEAHSCVSLLRSASIAQSNAHCRRHGTRPRNGPELHSSAPRGLYPMARQPVCAGGPCSGGTARHHGNACELRRRPRSQRCRIRHEPL